ncbi:FecR domain-containing protein [Rhizobium sp. S-51]|uniref:FecR domain-containing protein n=1 Tax=Rhizobium terricola TaxID=2728849 RepID=A0A7Y0AXJ8_9HYPH|nr:FecR domain-containing protein [Rhizobium terricola]NML75215.1 FecR domain-containing protein [Rhizobium terricola]
MRPCVFLVSIVLFILNPGLASAADWIASKVKQPVNFTVDKVNWTRLEAGMPVPGGAWISSGPRGRAVLTHEEDMVAIQPGSMVSVVAKDHAGDKFEIVQQIGEIVVDFEKRPGRNLSVQTPFLAAVVKGTRFTVSVDGKAAQLGVQRGLVGVTDPRRGERVDVRPGQSVAVSPASAGSLKVVGPGPKSPVVSVSASAPTVPGIGATANTADDDTSATRDGTTGNDKSDTAGSNGNSANDNSNAKGNGNANGNSSSATDGNGSANANSNAGGHGKDKDKDKGKGKSKDDGGDDDD